MSGEKKIRVMIADDSAFMHSIMSAMLKNTEFELVGQAKDGISAVETFEKTLPDILLLDIVMPGLTGPEILERVLKIKASTKVVMVSSLGTEDMVVECLKKGAKHFIQKPLEKEKLLVELRRLEGIAAPVTATAAVRAPATLSFTNILTGKHFFGEYLLEKHVITKDQLIKAVQYQKNVNMSLEQVCVRKGFLTDRAVARVHAVQKKDLDKDPAQIMLDEGFLTKDRLQEVLDEQKKTRVFIGEAMVKTGALTSAVLDRELNSYKADESREGAAVTAGLEKAKNQIIVKSFIDYTIKIMQRVMGEMSKVQACIPSTKEFMPQDYTVFQEARGDFDIGFLLNLPENLVLQIAATMYTKDVSIVNDEVQDAVKEFLNIIVGNSCAKLSSAGLKFIPLPPAFYDNRRNAAQAYKFGPKDEYLMTSLISNLGDFDVLVKM
jgi:YesN/AraC family two-component response regulator